MTTRVLLVDDHELIREGLARAFERDAGMSVVGQAGSVAEALAAWKALRPDVVVTDLQLPDGTGLDIIRAIRGESADAGLVMLTMHASDAQILDAMEAGASAFLGKEARGAEVVGAAAHAAKAPRSFLCTGLAGAVMRRSVHRGHPPVGAGTGRSSTSWPTVSALPRSPVGSTWVSPPSRRTSPGSTRSSAPATVLRPWSPPCVWGSSSTGCPAPADPAGTRAAHP